MKKSTIILSAIALLMYSGCKKDKDDPQPGNPAVTELQVLTDFANVLVNPNYLDIKTRAVELNVAVTLLDSIVSQANLINAQNAWRNLRQPWEQCEGFLFGPVEDFNYDPATDSWPVNTVELDSLLASSNPLELSDIEQLQFTLKGYHPIEYLLFGVGGVKTASQFNARELKYLTSLTHSLLNITDDLHKSWDVNGGNFTQELIKAGNGSSRYSTRKDAFIDIVTAMGHICNEVANNKMEVPFAALDSQLVESQYAHNATTDFKNNIIGIQNAYLCRYTLTGRSIHDIVKAKDLSLDNLIQSQITGALNALGQLDENFGIAIFNQHGQVLTAQNAVNDLNNTLGLLHNFVLDNITD